MRGVGQIAELCAIARPQLTLVSSIGPEHLELVGTIENVARANGEAIEALPPGGVAVVPVDEPLLEPYLRRATSRSAASTCARSPVSTRRGRRGGCTLAIPGGRQTELELELPFDQRHMAANVLGALTAYDALGLPLERAQEGAAHRALRLAQRRSRAAGRRR